MAVMHFNIPNTSALPSSVYCVVRENQIETREIIMINGTLRSSRLLPVSTSLSLCVADEAAVFHGEMARCRTGSWPACHLSSCTSLGKLQSFGFQTLILTRGPCTCSHTQTHTHTHTHTHRSPISHQSYQEAKLITPKATSVTSNHCHYCISNCLFTTLLQSDMLLV